MTYSDEDYARMARAGQYGRVKGEEDPVKLVAYFSYVERRFEVKDRYGCKIAVKDFSPLPISWEDICKMEVKHADAVAETG